MGGNDRVNKNSLKSVLRKFLRVYEILSMFIRFLKMKFDKTYMDH